MISREQYDTLKREYGDVASWAIWELPSKTAKSNIGIIPDFDDEAMLGALGTGFVFVGLNASSTHGEAIGPRKPWGNFHSGYSYGNDHKIRFALMDTKYWGSYMTDVIKRFPEVDSGKVSSVLRQTPTLVEESIQELKQEIAILGGKPILVAMGDEVHRLLVDHLDGEYEIVKIPHFSNWGSKEQYRKSVLKRLYLG